MNRVFQLCLMLAILIQPGLVQDPVAINEVDEAEKAIQASAESYVLAYNSRDAEKLAQLWAEKATYVLPDTGEKLVGREAIRESFTKMFAESESAAEQLTVTIESIRFITADVAVETGKSQVVQTDGNSSHSSYSAIHVKQNDQWLLDSIHDIESIPAASLDSPLNELDWMVGEWIDQTENSTVETVCQWTKNNSFLTRTFQVSAPGTDVLEGTQVIGWDPIAGHIRSWVYDSEGGYSEGIWQRKGESWVVESSGYTSDGGLAKSIQVYVPKDNNTFSWHSFGRQVGDEALPDIDEIQVIRK